MSLATGPDNVRQAFAYDSTPLLIYRPDDFGGSIAGVGFPSQFHVSEVKLSRYPLSTVHTAAGDQSDGPWIPYIILESIDGSSVPFKFLPNTTTLVQPIAPGLFARWFVQLVQSGINWVNQDATFTLIRIEGPGLLQYPGDGNVAKYDRLGGLFYPPYREWLWQSIVNPPTSIRDPSGVVTWLDGAGVPYGRTLKDGSWEVAVLDVYNQSIQWEYYDPKPMLRGADLAAFVKARLTDPRLWYGYVYSVSDYFAPRDTILSITDKGIKGLRPSEVLSLYYGLGKWEKESGNRFPIYRSPRFPHNWIAGAIYEYELRDRIYNLRPDLWNVKLADGSTIKGLVSYMELPALDGLVNDPRDDDGGWLDTVLNIASSLVMGATVVGTVAQLAAQGIQMADQMKSMENLRKDQAAMLSMVTDATTGAKAIIAIEVDPAVPGSTVGGSTAPGTSKGSGATPAILLAIVAAILAMR